MDVDFSEVEDEEGELSGEDKRDCCKEARRDDSAAWSLESSAATRCWMCRSRVLARVEFVCLVRRVRKVFNFGE